MAQANIPRTCIWTSFAVARTGIHDARLDLTTELKLTRLLPGPDAGMGGEMRGTRCVPGKGTATRELGDLGNITAAAETWAQLLLAEQDISNHPGSWGEPVL